jgi:hypothetical protein
VDAEISLNTQKGYLAHSPAISENRMELTRNYEIRKQKEKKNGEDGPKELSSP